MDSIILGPVTSESTEIVKSRLSIDSQRSKGDERPIWIKGRRAMIRRRHWPLIDPRRQHCAIKEAVYSESIGM